MTLERAYFEYNALVRQEDRDPGIVPSVFHFDREQGLIAMECLDSHKILRGKLIAGEQVENLGAAGISQWTPLAGLYTDIRHLRFADGPDEVHHMVVGRAEMQKYDLW